MAAALVDIVLVCFAFGAFVLKRALQAGRELALASDTMIIVRIQKGRVALGAVSGVEAVDAVIDHIDALIALLSVADEACTV